MDLGIAGHVAIVTGASKGLGLACARALVSAGMDVTLTRLGANPHSSK